MSRRLISCEPEFESVGLFVFGIGVFGKKHGKEVFKCTFAMLELVTRSKVLYLAGSMNVLL